MTNKRKKIITFIVLMLLPMAIGVSFLTGYLRGIEENINGEDGFTPRAFTSNGDRDDADINETTRRIRAFFSGNASDPYDQDFDKDSNERGTKMFPFGHGDKESLPEWINVPGIDPMVTFSVTPQGDHAPLIKESVQNFPKEWTPWILGTVGGGVGGGNGNGPPDCVPRHENSDNGNPIERCPDDEDEPVKVPEPGTLGLMILAFFSLMLFRRLDNRS